MATRDLRRMAIFAAVAEAGSIRAAARRLGLSAPVVSTALADLEADLGATLARRDGRRLALTAEGEAFAAAAQAMVSAAERALALFDAASRRPSGPLAVTLPTELCAGWLPPLLRGFEAAHPEVRVTIHAGDEAVDLARGDHDVAIRAAWHLRPPTGGDAIDLLPLALVAAPSLARRFRRLDATAGSSLPLIGFTARAPVDRLEALGPDGAAVSVPAATPIRVNSGLLAAELAREGFGAALVLRRAVAADLASGRLAPVLVPLSFGVVAVRILMRDARPSAAARAFAGFLRAARPPKGR